MVGEIIAFGWLACMVVNFPLLWQFEKKTGINCTNIGMLTLATWAAPLVTLYFVILAPPILLTPLVKGYCWFFALGPYSPNNKRNQV